MAQRAIVGCLLFSGLTALVYQIVWVRILGLAFGTTTEAIAAVLAVFFGGLALGSALAARYCRDAKRPLRLYGALEVFIGLFALGGLPLLRNLDRIYAWFPSVDSPAAWTALQLVATAALLLPPTLAMGAALPLVSRALAGRDATRGRSCALLYAANTGGAVAGAYLAGFWLVPAFGLSRCAAGAALANLGVGLVALALARDVATPPADRDPPPAQRRPFLVYFGLSGFVAIGYEVVWSKAFGIVMEGTLVGFSTVLSGFLLGIAIGSAAAARGVDRLANLPRAFATLHLAIGAAVIAGAWSVPQLPWLQAGLAQLTGAGQAARPHLLFALVLPLVFVPSALFGAAFPVLVRYATRSAGGLGRGIGEASAANTLGSIAGSLCVGLWWIPRLGSDATLYLLVLLQLATAVWILARHAAPEGQRLRSFVGATTLCSLLVLSYDGVGLARAVSGKQIATPSWSEYRTRLARFERERVISLEGRSSLVSVYGAADRRVLLTNGLPEASFHYRPPHLTPESVALALYPYAVAGRPQRALLVGLGGGNTLTALLRTPIARVEVVELEADVARAVEILHWGRTNPLDDARVELRLGDGRNDLLRRIARGEAGYDLIASQPSHPWRIGAANLFTEDYFRIARRALSEGGAFAVWIAGFRTDREAFLAVVASFERVFPGAVLADVDGGRRQSFLLVGARQPVRIDTAAVREMLAVPAVAELLRGYDVQDVEGFLASFEGPAAAFAALAPGASNRDDNAFVEMRAARLGADARVDYASIERALPDATPVLPPLEGPVDPASVASHLLERIRNGSAERRKLERLIASRRDDLDPSAARAWSAAARLTDPARRDAARSELEALAAAHPDAALPHELLAAYWERAGDSAHAGAAYAEAWRRSGRAEDAFGAGAALQASDPRAARAWFARIPEARRRDFPALAVYALDRALRDGARGAELRERYERVRALLAQTTRPLPPETHEIAAAVARALGDGPAARAHADAGAEIRRRETAALLDDARQRLAAGDPDGAWSALERAERVVASYPPLLELQARVAAARGDRDAVERALSALRFWAPSPEAGLGAENRLRSDLGLPLRIGTPPPDRSSRLRGPGRSGREAASLRPSDPSAPIV